jgi:hypothetical protein
MEKTVLNEVFEFLRRIEAVDTESEFSTDWLCRSESYMRSLRFKQVQPSMGTLAICASKLSHYGNKLKDKQKHADVSDQLLNLSDACHNQIGALSKMQWANE